MNKHKKKTNRVFQHWFSCICIITHLLLKNKSTHCMIRTITARNYNRDEWWWMLIDEKIQIWFKQNHYDEVEKKISERCLWFSSIIHNDVLWNHSLSLSLFLGRNSSDVWRTKNMIKNSVRTEFRTAMRKKNIKFRLRVPKPIGNETLFVKNIY